MFWKFVNWIKSWFVSSNNFYHPKERTIYSYWDGQKLVREDPMILYRKLMEIGPELSIDIKVAQSMSKDANKAQISMIQKMRKIFSVKQLSEDGLTEAETLGLFDHFMTFCDGLKKNLKNSQTSVQETSGTSNFSLEGIPPTSNSSESGSIENGAFTDLPSQSPMESESPLVP